MAAAYHNAVHSGCCTTVSCILDLQILTLTSSVLVNENGFLTFLLIFICRKTEQNIIWFRNSWRLWKKGRERVYHLSSEKNEVITIINVFHISGCRASLGMEGGSIKDSQITAQSSANTAHNGRLYSSSSWCSSNSDAGYLQVTLLCLYCVVLCCTDTRTA